MSLWRHAMTTKWLGGLGVALLFAGVTTVFGLWQWDRRGQRDAQQLFGDIGRDERGNDHGGAPKREEQGQK